MRLSFFANRPFLSKPKILVIGYGFVGKTVVNNLMKHGYSVSVLDPAQKTLSSVVRSHTCDGAIICVNTPTTPDGKCDDSNVRDAIRTAQQLVKSGRILVKSTVTPDLAAKYPEQVVMNPEFLTQANRYHDFANQKFMVFGGDEKQAAWWSRVFRHIECERVFVTREGACWFKYIHNTWLATKVVFFHEMHKAAEAHGQLDDLQGVLGQIAEHDPQVGPSHMYAPNQRGTLGYTGSCFPKDTAAFAQFTNASLLNEVTKINDRLNNEQL